MNLNHLKAFVKAVQVKSYQEAAKLLGVSQPAITQRINTLEDHFQTKLISRNQLGITLTPQGEFLYKESMEILEKWNQLEYYYWSNQPTGNIAIGASTIPSEYLLPLILKEFRIQFPKVHFNVQVSGSSDIQRLLMDRSVDVIVTGEPDNHEQIESVSIFNDQLTVIMPPSERVDQLELNDLFHYDWILREPRSNTRQVFEKALVNKGRTMQELHVVGQLGSTEAIISAVEAGLGISVVSSLAATRAEKYGRAKIVPIRDLAISRDFCVSYLTENKYVSTIAAFLNFIKGYEFEI